MEQNGYYSSDNRSNRGEGGRGGSAFATIVIVLVIILLGLLVVGLFWPNLLGGSTTDNLVLATPTPTVTATPGPESTQGEAQLPSESPTPTPDVSTEDRQMPELDGISPNLPGMVDNPIPDIYDAVSPGVVGVINYTKATSATGKEVYEIYGSGTGFAVSSEGYILTNAHVVEGADKVTVKVDGEDEERHAGVIGSDTETDVAVLKVEGATLQPLKLGDSDSVRVGEYVLAIGNPLSTDELANTLTFGIISATSREVTIDNYTNTYLQTDAAINFGNSGGPLINMSGEVIGITVSTVTDEIAEANDVPVGALVESVVKDRPADQAGLLAGDIIVEANGKTITNQDELVQQVLACTIGDELKLKVYRDGEYMEITIVVGNKTEMNFDDVAGATPSPSPEVLPIP